MTESFLAAYLRMRTTSAARYRVGAGIQARLSIPQVGQSKNTPEAAVVGLVGVLDERHVAHHARGPPEGLQLLLHRLIDARAAIKEARLHSRRVGMQTLRGGPAAEARKRHRQK